MIYRFIIYFLLGGVLIASQARAQEVKADIEKINQAYGAQKGFAASVLYQWFPTYQATKPSQEIRGEVQKLKNQFYTDYEAAELLINDKYSITINHNERIVLLQPAPEGLTETQFTVDLDSALTWCSKYEMRETSSKERMIELSFTNASHSTIQIWYNPESFLIDKLIFYLRSPIVSEEGKAAAKPRVEIHYQDIKLNKSVSESAFSEKKYFKRMGKQPQLSDTYTSYRLVNYLPH